MIETKISARLMTDVWSNLINNCIAIKGLQTILI